MSKLILLFVNSRPFFNTALITDAMIEKKTRSEYHDIKLCIFEPLDHYQLPDNRVIICRTLPSCPCSPCSCLFEKSAVVRLLVNRQVVPIFTNLIYVLCWALLAQMHSFSEIFDSSFL